MISSQAEQLRVGYLLRMYPRFTQTFVVNEILELERQGIDVRIGSLRKPTDGCFHESICRVKAPVEYFPEYMAESRSKQLRTHVQAWRKEGAAYLCAARHTSRYAGIDWTDFRQAALVLKWARKNKLAHVHVHFGTHEASVALLAHIMGGLAYSLTLHAFDIFRDNVDRRLLSRKINASRFTVTVSEYNKTFMVKHLPDVDPQKIRVNYNGIDLERFRPNGTQRRAGTIVGVGRLIEKKGFIHLVRAVGILRDHGVDVQCTIIGDGPLRGQLRDEIKTLGLKGHVTLAGSLSQDQVRDRLAEASCFALPCVEASDGNIDALPTVLLEAMAAGCPCVSTRLSGVPEIIENETSGLLVPPGHPRALAQALERLLTDDAIRGDLAVGGRRRAEERFDIGTNVGTMNMWFTHAAQEPCGVGDEQR